MNFLPLVHALVVVSELVLAGEAVAFSIIFASDHRAGELGGIAAMRGGGVAAEVWPTLEAEAAVLDGTGEGGLRVSCN